MKSERIAPDVFASHVIQMARSLDDWTCHGAVYMGFPAYRNGPSDRARGSGWHYFDRGFATTRNRPWTLACFPHRARTAATICNQPNCHDGLRSTPCFRRSAEVLLQSGIPGEDGSTFSRDCHFLRDVS